MKWGDFMYSLIKDYELSCSLIKKRIKFLTHQRNMLIKSGEKRMVDDMNLEKRIRLLYVEYEQTMEIVEHLTNYARRVNKRVKT